MIFKLLPKRAGSVGLVLTAYDIWRRLPPEQRRMIVNATRQHGPRLVRAAADARKARRVKP